MVSQPVMTHRRGEVHRVVQALHRGDGLALEDDARAHRLHAEHADALLHEHGEHHLLEAAVVRVHHVERHLHGVEGELVLVGGLEHREVDVGILVTGEADEAQLACLLGLHERLDAAARGEGARGIGRADHLVDLHEVDVVHAEPLQ